jgi:hypothetical protein
VTSSAIRERLKVVKAGIDAAYWAFTRQARAKPPVLAVPHLYAERREFEAELARRSARKRAR